MTSTFYKKTHFVIISLRPSKVAPTKDVPFSRNDHLDNYKKNKKLLILFSKNSATLVLYVLYMPAKFCIPKASFRTSKVAPTKHIPYDLPKKKWLLEKMNFDIVRKKFNT